MKTLFKILFLGILTVLLTIAAMAKENPSRLRPAHEKDKNIFVYKADKTFVGARVEILQANGNVIAEQVLTKRKLVIDFNDTKSGSYTIRLIKGDKVEEIVYQKL
jgi:hypothetical protein